MMLARGELVVTAAWALRCQLLFGVAIWLFLAEASGWAVTRHQGASNTFITQLSQIRPGLDVPSQTNVVTVSVNERTLRKRALKSGERDEIEPLTIAVPTNRNQLDNLAIDLAQPGRASRLQAYLTSRIKAQQSSGPEVEPFHRVEIDQRGLALIDLSKVASLLDRQHQEVFINTRLLRRDRELTRELLEQVRPFLTTSQFYRLRSQISQGRRLSLEEDLLPDFARRMVRRFIPYRGPNCFHAALAFHGEELTRSPHINFRDEPGYHRSMINYDELWRFVQKGFYEIDPSQTPLKFGDMIIFFEVDDAEAAPHFRWIRHAATYLFGPYTFSKGSKSPNTPYTVKTMSEEWDTWQRLSRNLGVKVFRRSPKNVTTLPPKDRLDWIY